VPKRKPSGKSFLFNEPICGVVVITSDEENVMNDESKENKRENMRYDLILMMR
jgi:hypothetical protein